MNKISFWLFVLVTFTSCSIQHYNTVKCRVSNVPDRVKEDQPDDLNSKSTIGSDTLTPLLSKAIVEQNQSSTNLLTQESEKKVSTSQQQNIPKYLYKKLLKKKTLEAEREKPLEEKKPFLSDRNVKMLAVLSILSLMAGIASYFVLGLITVLGIWLFAGSILFTLICLVAYWLGLDDYKKSTSNLISIAALLSLGAVILLINFIENL